MIDGFPMPVCKITRAAKSKSFQGEAGYSYCAAKDEKYYGFEGHVIISFDGIITGQTFAAANLDEREVVEEITSNLHGLLIGDKGYTSRGYGCGFYIEYILVDSKAIKQAHS